MKYFSTRNSNEKVSASWAISHGLAPDGGLYVPESLPMLSLDDIKTLGKKDYRGRALSIMKHISFLNISLHYIICMLTI